MQKLLTKSNSLQSGVRKRTINSTFSIGPLSMRFITIAIAAAIALFYLTQSTQSATKSYSIQELEREKTKEIEKQKVLETEVIRLQSLKEIKNNIEELGLEGLANDKPQPPQ